MPRWAQVHREFFEQTATRIFLESASVVTTNFDNNSERPRSHSRESGNQPPLLSPFAKGGDKEGVLDSGSRHPRTVIRGFARNDGRICNELLGHDTK